MTSELDDFYYAKPSENAALATYTPTVTLQTATVNPRYPLSRLTDLDPATHFKCLAASDARIVFAYAGAQPIEAVWIPMHNIPAGTVIRWEGHTSNAWGSPAFSKSFTVPTWFGDLPRGLFINLTTAAGFSAGGFQYNSLFVPNISKPLSIGELFPAVVLRGITHLEYFSQVQQVRTRALIQTPREDGGYFQYDKGRDLYLCKGDVTVRKAMLDLYETLNADSHDGYYGIPVVINVYDTTPEGFYVRWASGFAPTFKGADQYTLSLAWEMKGRGRVS